MYNIMYIMYKYMMCYIDVVVRGRISRYTIQLIPYAKDLAKFVFNNPHVIIKI